MANGWTVVRMIMIFLFYVLWPPKGETRDMERKTGESYTSCTIPVFPPLVAQPERGESAASQSAECLSYHMTLKVNPVTLTL